MSYSPYISSSKYSSANIRNHVPSFSAQRIRSICRYPYSCGLPRWLSLTSICQLDKSTDPSQSASDQCQPLRVENLRGNSHAAQIRHNLWHLNVITLRRLPTLACQDCWASHWIGIWLDRFMPGARQNFSGWCRGDDSLRLSLKLLNSQVIATVRTNLRIVHIWLNQSYTGHSILMRNMCGEKPKCT